MSISYIANTFFFFFFFRISLLVALDHSFQWRSSVAWSLIFDKVTVNGRNKNGGRNRSRYVINSSVKNACSDERTRIHAIVIMCS